jgi:Invasion associated locus B (IalB) protein
MMLRKILAPLAGACLLAPAALAVEPTSIGKFDDWEAFTYRTKDTRVCYAFSAPKKSEAAKKVKRDPIYFMVTHWPGRNVRGQISTIIGYPFKETSTVKLSVDTKDFVLYTAGDMAWADRAETDVAILTAMKSGMKSGGALTVTGTSTRGTVTTDIYSLNGISAAMDKINTACK